MPDTTDRPTASAGRDRRTRTTPPAYADDRPAPGHRSRPGREETCTGREETVTTDRPEYGTKAGDAMAYSAWLR
ncbi:hypothetical protein [Streptomyces sp. SID8499]|uniref:hypothetical protein n=1 Tax=Streptomyces sp. SID8499 TaxID=2706106 RepID=UPI0013CBBA07|nr:hypothetical protein [Streptomyces sp. SID8499]NED38143.1 hypothetical protein [Streptomyces sp. SID8499]